MSSIILDGIRDVDLGFRVLEESQDPLIPSTRDQNMLIDGRHGSYDFGAVLDPKPFVFECAFIPQGTSYERPSASELQKRVRRLAEFMTDTYGRPRNMRLVRSWEPDKYYIVRYSGSAPLERIAYSSIGLFTLPLVAFDPFAYSTQERIIETTVAESPTTIVAESDGNVRTQPVIVLTNQGSNTITHFRIVNEYRLEG